MYQYTGFGLHILSEIEFPELLPCSFNVPHDLKISVGEVPEKLEGNDVHTSDTDSINNSEYILNVTDVARYYACDGNNIIVAPETNADAHSVRLYVLGTVIAVVLYQRSCIPLHASGVVHEGELILFTGYSGAGKSTTLASLAKMGYEIFTDDICVLKMDEDSGIVSGTASYPMLKLWEDSIEKLGEERYNKRHNIRPGQPKYAQFFHDDFDRRTLPVKKIFVLNKEEELDQIAISSFQPMQAFRELQIHAYRQHLILATHIRTTYFHLLTSLCSKAAIYKVSRPIGNNTVKELPQELSLHF